ncbi:MAG: gliding motility lipoprotein GldH [Bacteroidales bacterium]|nr:gliding motility lipoprotein GldH [Bacteroidales bacterium]
MATNLRAMIKLLKTLIIGAFIAPIILTACSTNDVYNDYIALPNKGWGTDSLAVFRTQIDDASASYNLWIQIRNENDYPYSNLWLFIDVVSPDGQMARDTLECILARPDGSWLGGGWGSLYSLQCPYRLNSHFAQSGNYTFRMAHGMRDDDIRGIHSLGLRIEKNEKADGKE